jgi:hypothetical protein
MTGSTAIFLFINKMCVMAVFTAYVFLSMSAFAVDFHRILVACPAQRPGKLFLMRDSACISVTVNAYFSTMLKAFIRKVTLDTLCRFD